MLTVEGLRAGYDGATVLRGVDLRIGSGELVAVIGPNGAGKSTLLRAISGLTRPTGGRVLLEGRDITRLDPDAIVRAGIVHVPEGRLIFGRMSVRENLMIGAYARPRGSAAPGELDEILDLFPVLRDRLGQIAGTLSGGEQQMLAIGRGLMAAPRLLMLDEPSLGVAPLLVQKIFEAVLRARASGLPILLVEQNATKALEIADRAYALEFGAVALNGDARELLGDDRVRQAYLGI